jgi:hypothetical protein
MGRVRMIAERRTARARVRPLPVAASAGLHLIVLTLLVWRLGTAPALPEAPVMNVELAPRRARPSPAPPAERRLERPARGQDAVSPSPRVLAAPPATAPEASPVAEGDAVQRTLRGLLGCPPGALARMTPEARRRCEDRLAAAGPRDLGRAAGRLNLDLRGDFARNPEPYLNRWPKNGCKPRAGGDVAGPLGQQGAAAGLTCAWDF